jgi:hypothetical protein
MIQFHLLEITCARRLSPSPHHVSTLRTPRYCSSSLTMISTGGARLIIEIDERIAVLESELLNLRRKRNTLSSVCLLPSEIWVAILVHLQHDSSTSSGRFRWEVYDPKWTRIMLACQHLRNVAISTPTLWNLVNHTEHKPEWVDLCLQRSEDAPLYMHSRRAEASPHWNRVIAAHLSGSDAARTMFSIASTSLKTLSACTSNEQNPLLIELTSFPHVASSLVHLVLEGIGIRLEDGPCMPQLRRLEISSIRTDSTLIPLVNFLSKMPALQYLALSWLLLSEGTTAVDGNEIMLVPERVAIPDLRALCVTDAPAETWAVLRTVPTPTTAFGVSITDASSFTDAERMLTANRINVYDAWRGFARLRPDAAGLARGRADLNHRDGRGLLCTISFGRRVEVEQFSDSDCFCYIICKLDRTHPILDHVHAMVLSRDKVRSMPFEELDTSGVQFLHALDTLVFQDLTEDDIPWMKLVGEWAKTRQKKIERVVFMQCAGSIRVLAEEMCHEAMVPDVSWED